MHYLSKNAPGKTHRAIVRDSLRSSVRDSLRSARDSMRSVWAVRQKGSLKDTSYSCTYCPAHCTYGLAHLHSGLQLSVADLLYLMISISDNTATNIRLLALLTGGEGLHNNHHGYPRSPKFSFTLSEFDPAWPLIWLLTKVGLARPYKTIPQAQES